LRRDLVQPSDPDRQAGPARAAARLAAPTGTARSRTAGGGQEPGVGLLAALARRAGLAHRAAHQRQGIPRAADSPRRCRLSTTTVTDPVARIRPTRVHGTT